MCRVGRLGSLFNMRSLNRYLKYKTGRKGLKHFKSYHLYRNWKEIDEHNSSRALCKSTAFTTGVAWPSKKDKNEHLIFGITVDVCVIAGVEEQKLNMLLIYDQSNALM